MVAMGEMGTGKRRAKPATKEGANMRAAILELERALGTRGRIVGNQRRGRIEIRYFSSDDLDRIYKLILKT